jgi:RNA polymerase sigma-70 factor, ECF subfamily
VDRVLVEQARRGDHDAFAQLLAEAIVPIEATARLILRDRSMAEDATQEALVRAWRELPRLRDPDRFEAWLRRLVVNACYDEARRARRRPTLVMLPADAAHPIAADAAMAVADRDEIGTAFDRLTDDQRAVLVLRHYLGLSTAEIGETLGIPAGTAASRLHYATQAMRAALEANGRREAAEKGWIA